MRRVDDEGDEAKDASARVRRDAPLSDPALAPDAPGPESDAQPRRLAPAGDELDGPEQPEGQARRLTPGRPAPGELPSASDAWPRRTPEPPAATWGVGGEPEDPAPAPIRRASAAERARRRRRLAVGVLGGLVLLLLLARLLLWLLLPGLLVGAARDLVLDLRMERLELSVLRGELRAGGVVVRPLEGGDPLLTLASLRVDVTTRELIFGRVRVAAVEVDGLEVTVERDADGGWAVARRLERSGVAAVESTAPPAGVEARAPALPDLSFLRVDAVWLRGLRARLVDRSLPGAPRRTVTAEVTLTDLVVADDAPPASLRVTLASEDGLREARLEGRVGLGPRRAGARLALRVDGLRPAAAAPWLARLAVAPVASSLDLAADLRADVGPSVARGEGLALALGLSRLALRADGVEVAAVDLAAVDVAALGSASIEVTDLVVAGVRGGARRTPEGALRALGFERWPGSVPRPAPAARNMRTAGGQVAEVAASRFRALDVRSARVHGVSLLLEDEGVSPPTSTRLEIEEVRLHDLVLDPSRPDVPLGIDLRLRLPGVMGALALRGDAALVGERPWARLDVTLDGLRGQLVGEYLRPLGIAPTLSAGRIAARLEASGRPTAAGGFEEGQVTLRDLRLVDGVAPLASVTLVRVLGARFDPAARLLRLERLEVDGPSCALGRDADGALVGLGLRYATPPPRSGGGDLVGRPAAPPRPAVEAKGPAPLARLELGGVRLGRLQVAWRDALPATPVDVDVVDGGLELGPLGLTLEAGASAAAPAPTPVRAWLELPGAGGRLEAKGEAVASTSSSSLRLGVRGAGMSLERLRPYLEPLGVEATLTKGSLLADLEASAGVEPDGLDAELRLTHLRLADGERALLDVADVALRGARLRSGAVEVERVDLGRTRAAVELEATEAGPALALLGLRLRPPPPRPPDAPTHPAPVSSAARVWPRVVVGAVRVDELALDLRDARPLETPDGPLAPLDLPLRLEASLGPLVVDPAADEPAVAPLHVSVGIAGVASRVAIDGGLSLGWAAAGPRAGVRFALRGEGLQTALLGERLRGLGLDLAFAGPADLTLDASASARVDGQRLGADLSLRDVRLVDAVEEWAGVDAVLVRGVDVAPTASGALALAVTGVEVVRPRALVRREADGALVVAGLRLGPDAGTAATSSATTSAATTSGASPELTLGGLRIAGAALAWDDRRPAEEGGAEAVRLEATLDATVGAARVGVGAASAPLQLLVRVPGLVEGLRVDGLVRLDPTDLAARLEVRAAGLTPGPLAPYLPPTLGLDLGRGALRADLTARVQRLDDGGSAVQARVAEVALTDGARSLLRVDELILDVARIDSRSALIDRLALTGVETAAVRSASGDVALLGLVLRAAAAPDASVEAAPDANLEGPAAPSKIGTRRPVRRVTLRALDVELRRAELVREGNVPLVVAARLRSEAPFTLGGPDAAEHAPARLVLEASALPALDRVEVRVAVAPFAVEPTLDVGLLVEGLRGEGIAAVASELLARLDPRGLEDGRVTGHLAAALRVARTDPLDSTWLQRGFGADVTLSGVRVTDGPDGEPLAGLDSLRLDVARASVGGPIVVRSAEIERPALRVTKEADGLHLLGLVLPPSTDAPPAPAPATPTGPPARPRELRIDALLLTGLDVRFEDRTVTPPLVVPLSDVDLEVDGLTTLAAIEAHALRLDVTLQAGQVRLPPPAPDSVLEGIPFVPGLLADIVTGAVDRLRGGSDAPEEELRPLWELVRVRCDLMPRPRVRGTLQAEVRGLELVAFAGLARRAEVELFDGTADLDVQGRFPGDRFEGRLLARLHRLAMTEGPNGPFRRHIPGGVVRLPLESLLIPLRDDRKTITVPVRLDLGADELDEHGLPPTEAISGAIWGTVGRMLKGAAINSGKKVFTGTVGAVAGGVGKLVPRAWLGDGDQPMPLPAPLGFCPGDTCLRAGDDARLRPLGEVAALEDGPQVVLEHALGPADVAVLTSRVAPSAPDARGVRAGLQATRAALLRSRTDAAAAARAALLAGLVDEARAEIETARGLEQELGAVERGLDEATRLVVGEAPHVRQRRLRDAAKELGQARLEAARQALLRAGVPDDRIRVAPPRFDRRVPDGEGRVVVTLEVRDERRP